LVNSAVYGLFLLTRRLYLHELFVQGAVVGHRCP
jgi:hypothetical protein